MRLPFRRLVGLALLVGFAAAPVAAQRFDQHGRRVPVPQGEVPLLVGPPNAYAWRVHRRPGQQLPVRIDRRVLYSNPTSFRLVLPRLGPAGNDAEIIVDGVRNDAGVLDATIARSLPRLSVPVAYSGSVRGSVSGVAVISVLGGVFYGRIVAGEDTWLLYSTPRGIAYVQLDVRDTAGVPLPPGVLPPGLPGAPPRAPRR